MVGWETQIAIAEDVQGWGSSLTGSKREVYAESDGLDIAQVIKERDDKIIQGRYSLPSSRTVDQQTPNGNISLQPRMEEILMILMNHFQSHHFDGTVYGGTVGGGTLGIGTFTFAYPINRPDWVGSSWGSFNASVNLVGTAEDVYPVSLFKSLGQDPSDSSVFFRNGICDTLEIVQEWNADLIWTPTWKFYEVGYLGNPAGGTSPTYQTFTDWMATTTFKRMGVEKTVEISKITISGNNGLGERSKIGKLGFSKFPFSGRPVVEVSLDLEYEEFQFLQDLVSRTNVPYSLDVVWLNSSDNCELTIHVGTMFFRPWNPTIPGGQDVLEYTITFRGYPDEDAGTSPLIIKWAGTFSSEFFMVGKY